MNLLQDAHQWLWSDIGLWILFIGLIWFVGTRIYLPYERAMWGKVFSKPIPLIAVWIFGTFLMIGMADSIHFRAQNNEIYSLLDYVLRDNITQMEQSYSAPFATTLLNSVPARQADGTIIPYYAPLVHGGSHLLATEDPGADILKRCLPIGIVGIMAFVFLKIFSRKYSAARRVSLGYIWFLSLMLWFVIEFNQDYHLLGTSQVGMDVLYETLKGVRTGLVIGTISSVMMVPFALVLGILSGYFRGVVDDVIQYFYTTLSAIPGVLLIGAAVLSLQVLMDNHASWFGTVEQRSDVHLLALCGILGVTSWTSLCRLIRGETLKLSQLEFVQAAQVLGVSTVKIFWRHLVPNLMYIIVISMAMDFSSLVLAEAVLSYVGVGVDPNTFSWGGMIDSARLELARDPIVWWNLFAAFLAMLLLVLSANIIADGVRDVYDRKGLAT